MNTGRQRFLRFLTAYGSQFDLKNVVSGSGPCPWSSNRWTWLTGALSEYHQHNLSTHFLLPVFMVANQLAINSDSDLCPFSHFLLYCFNWQLFHSLLPSPSEKKKDSIDSWLMINEHWHCLASGGFMLCKCPLLICCRVSSQYKVMYRFIENILPVCPYSLVRISALCLPRNHLQLQGLLVFFLLSWFIV